MERKNNLKFLAALGVLTLGAFSCQKKADDVVAPKKLYVASGQCYSGSGITTYTAATGASRVVTTWDADTGASNGVFTDLNYATNISTGTVPQKLIDNGDSVLMLTENGTTFGDRKVWKVLKSNPNAQYGVFVNEPNAFASGAANITRSFGVDVDGTVLMSRSVAIEKLTSVGARIVKGANNPWINPAIATGTCFTAAATQIQAMQLMSPFSPANQGKVVYIHSGTTAATNRIGIVQRTGLVSGDGTACAGSNPVGGLSTVPHQNAPNLPAGGTAFVAPGPSVTSMVYIPTPAPATTTAKLITSYSAALNTQNSNSTVLGLNFAIVMWDITETSDTAATVANPVILYKDESIIWGISAMAYNSSDGSLFVAVGGAPSNMDQTANVYGYNIEKFALNINTPSLTRVSPNNQPFITGNTNTKCISDMMLSNN
jgi:hypothetical protein